MAGRRSRRRRRAHRIKVFIILLALAGVIYILLPYCCVMEQVTIEAGESCPGAAAFLKWENKNASLVSEINENTVFHHVGDHDVTVRVYGRNVASVLHVKDTVAPEVVTKDVTLFGGGNVEIEDFVVEIKDETPYSVRFLQEPDCSAAGASTVLLEVQD